MTLAELLRRDAAWENRLAVRGRLAVRARVREFFRFHRTARVVRITVTPQGLGDVELATDPCGAGFISLDPAEGHVEEEDHPATCKALYAALAKAARLLPRVYEGACRVTYDAEGREQVEENIT